MGTYVVEINGRGIVAFSNASIEAAQAYVDDDEAFRADLMVLENEGAPLWDGEAKLVVRKAAPEEEAKLKAIQANGARSGDEENADDLLIFLVPVFGPSDED